MKLCFTGDLFIGGDLITSSIEKNSLISSHSYHSASLRVSNLEQSFGSADSRLEGKSTLYASPKAINLAENLKINVAALSNNHIQDLGSDQINDIFRLLDENGIHYFGAGGNDQKARAPFWIDKETCILGYCESDKPYLKKVQSANKNQPGVNKLTYDRIISDLKNLPQNSRAILHFHWGVEHVALPDFTHIKLAKQLLQHNQVLMIIGMHAHRIQGFVEHNGKKAYMCLGNFLFPNFYLEPRTHISYPESIPENIMITKDYHFVGKLTYKKWRLKNRISLLVLFDTKNNKVSHIPVLQDHNKPIVTELTGFRKQIILHMVKWYSLLYRLPGPLYISLQKANVLWNNLWRYSYVFLFLIRQNGLNWSLRKAISFSRNTENPKL